MSSKSIALCLFLTVAVSLLVIPPLDAAETNPFLKGLSEFKAENYEEALQSFERAYKENPKDPRVTFYLGVTHREMHNYAEAVQFFKETLALQPKTPEIKFMLADVLFGTERYAEALQEVEEVLKAGYKPGQSSYLKGAILLKLKRNAEAIEAFKTARQHDPSLAQQADFQIAAAYMQERDFKKAKEMFKGLTTVDPTSDWALYSKDYLEALEKIPPPYRVSIGLGYQYDDNVLSTPILKSLVNVHKEEDWKRLFSLFGEYTLLTKGPWNVKASYALGITQHKRNNYPTTDGGAVFNQDTVSHTVSLLPSYNTEKSVTSMLLSYNYLEVDYFKYKQSFLVSPSHLFLLKNGSKGSHLGQVFVRYRNDELNWDWNLRKFGAHTSLDEDRDAHNGAVGLGYFYTFANGTGLFNVKVEKERNDALGKNWDYRGAKLTAGLLYPLVKDKLRSNTLVEFYRQTFSNDHSIYGIKRRDASVTFQTSLTYALMKPVDVSIGYTHLGVDSNISVYEFRRNIYSMNVEYRF